MLLKTKYGIGVIIKRFDFDLCLVKHHNRQLPLMSKVKSKEILLLPLKITT